MNKRGFTLVELLAIIVILSLLTLIGSTTVTKLVKNSKEKLYDAQIELIKVAAESWGSNNLDKLPVETGECKYITLKNLKTYGILEESIINPKTNKEFSDDMKIKITSTLTELGNLNFQYEVDSIDVSSCNTTYPLCLLVSDSDNSNTITPGDKYLCRVKDVMEKGFENGYYFYVLSHNNDGTINLIMDRNINSDGTLVTKAITESDKALNDGIYNLVAYNSSGDVSGTGPVTAMTYLNNATSSWENIDNLNLTYDDEGKNFTGFALNGKSRLPYLSEVDDYDMDAGTNAYLYENLDGSGWYESGTQPTNNISGIYGYWTLSSGAVNSPSAWRVYYRGNVSLGNVDAGLGVRAVINLKI